MNQVRILDCTLRDGGYCNQWNFGFENIRKIVKRLVDAKIDIIECGFLTNKKVYNKEYSLFTTMDEVKKILPASRGGRNFVCMLNYGEYNLEDIPEYDGKSLDGIRVAFHKKDMLKALELCAGIKKKGYMVYVQAMVSLNYSDIEFLELINRCNEFKPTAFYIVDSFGVMKRKDLIRLFYLVEHNLNENIFMGYHSHNNMQLSFANAQALVDIQTKRLLIIDSSTYGMGRGAGNLNTELFVEYLNDNLGTTYLLKPLLSIIDEVINDFYLTNYWGYSLPNYLSAAYNCHPNYASYLDDKKTLTIENMYEIFSMIADDKRNTFDKAYIELLYLNYLSNEKIYEKHLTDLKKVLHNKKVLIIAPGKSVEDEKEKVISFASSKDVVSISINFDYAHYNTDFIFVSNLRRFRELDKSKRSKSIVTSNIPGDGVYLQTKYSDLLNNIEAVRDNAGMMLIKYLIHLEVQEIMIAGIDGYSYDSCQNFADQHMAFITKRALLDTMNLGMCEILKEFSKKSKLTFLTTPKLITL